MKNIQPKAAQQGKGPQKSQFLDEWDNERKKLNLLSVIFAVILAAVVAMVAISVIRGHI